MSKDLIERLTIVVERMEAGLNDWPLASQIWEYRSAINRIEQLEAEIAALRAEVDDVKQVQFPRKLEAVADGWRKKFATSQANEMQLREAIAYINHSMNQALLPGNDKHRELILSQSMSAQALTLPSDTTALEALIQNAGEIMRERSEKVVEEGTAFIPFQGVGYYQFAANRCRAIRAIPAITLEDINK